MFKEILNIIPKLSNSDLNNMERSLQSRFARVAKGFGKGLVATLTGGGIAGAALGIIDKLLNPLKETQDAIDRTLQKADDMVTNAKAFGGSSGELARLHSFARATGLESSSLDMLIQKFQVAVAEAAQDPAKPTAVRAYAGDQNTLRAFFEFIQALQKMPKNQQLLVQQEVFGEKQILKMADFLQSDFRDLWRKIGGNSAPILDPIIDDLGAKKDRQDELAAAREMKDWWTKGKGITDSMITKQDEMAKLELARENRQIKAYNDLAAISIAAGELMAFVRDAALKLTALLVQVTNLTAWVQKLTNSRMIKGFMKSSGE